MQQEKGEVIKANYSRKLHLSVLVVVAALSPWAQAKVLPHSATLATSDVRVRVYAGQDAPNLVDLSSPTGASWHNEQKEALPPTVEVNGTSVPVAWQAHAGFGPVEHRITIENLGDQEVWLPMVDSLRLDWQVPASAELRNFYIEKGAGSPSAEGTHLETVTNGYGWSGKSSAYAHPKQDEAREIIPAAA